jgi:dienelactone hydrolase
MKLDMSLPSLARVLFCGFSALVAPELQLFSQDFQRPPEKTPSYARPLAPLLEQNGSPVTDAAGWRFRCDDLRGQWMRLLGPFPAQKVALEAKAEDREELPTFTRQRFTYQLEEGVRTDAMVLLPRNVTGRLPAIVLFHPTYEGHYRRVVGLEGLEDPERHQAIQLVEAGFAVIAPRCFLWEEIPSGFQTKGSENGYAARVRHMNERHPDWKGMTRMTWDGIRALDFAQSLPQVDGENIGIFGHSLGAKEVLYVAAFDTRPKCVVFSEGGIGMRQSNWDAVWYLGPQIQGPNFSHEHHELLGLIAPRPFLILAGGAGKGAADTEASWLFVEAARPVYELLSAKGNIGWFNHGLGHRYGGSARESAEGFLKRHLKERAGVSGAKVSGKG